MSHVRFVLCAMLELSSLSSAFAHDGNSIFNLSSNWTDQNGKEFRLDSLRGRPSVVTMAYTSCQASCPLIVEDMKKIEAHVLKAAKNSPRFVLFSFDSKRDTPVRLKAFAQNHKLDFDHWILLQGNAKVVRELSAVLGIRYKQDAQGEFDHSNVISFVDEFGVVRHQQFNIGQNPKKLETEFFELAKAKSDAK